MKIRCKFALTHLAMTSSYPGHISHRVTFTPQYDPAVPEDQRFAAATPNGEFHMSIDNPPVVEFLKARLGQQFYFDVEEADPQ